MTVHRALRELKAEGVIVRVPGRGTFVSSEKPRTTLLETQDIAEEIRGRGSAWSCRVEALEEVGADQETAAALGLKPGDPVYHSAIVHEENGEPVQFEERWVNPAAAPGYLDQDFTRQTPYRFLMASAPLTEVEHVLHAIRPDRAHAGLSRHRPGRAVPAARPADLVGTTAPRRGASSSSPATATASAVATR